MSMTIGKEAREALTQMAMRLSINDCAELLQVLDDCTDAPEVGLPEGWVAVPVEPSDAHLMSMALRHDHAVGLRTQEGIAASMRLMRQLYEEATGQGFYALDGSNSERYREMMPAALTDSAGQKENSDGG